ncbi:MAG TPA: hypothetical protein VN851_18085, partial [Thermoanaerobaculia bacterium]|nr:hypothetical protein [Thermoanaerobaculia bacterium]
RIVKRGYIEVPSRAFESTPGVERPGMAGLSHHRWLIEIRDQRIDFQQKYSCIHSLRFCLPPSYKRRLTPATAVQWLWWDDRFEFQEVSHYGIAEMEGDLESFVRETCPHPLWRLAFDRKWQEGKRLASRARDLVTARRPRGG